MVEVTRRAFFRHPLAALGAALTIAGGFAFFILLLLELAAGTDNPYTALVTFVAAPAVMTLGFVLFILAVIIQIRQARKRGEAIRFSLVVSPTNPRPLRTILLFVGLTLLFLVIIAYAGVEAYNSTESVSFCGKACHEVMEPQYVTYYNSPHARVPCVECHIGPGASFWVKSKIDGIRQVLAVIRNSYSKPIQTPVTNLRPAQETCEECHWPRQFYGEKLVTHTYYRTDEENSPWTINLLVKIGGGNPRTGRLEGIHWHMLQENKVEYVATDPTRQTIPWLRVVKPDGTVEVFADEDFAMPDTSQPGVELRVFDCMDCHNRPSHKFLPPASAMNLAISKKEISRDLPYIRKVGLEVLNKEYTDSEQAYQAIAYGLETFYQENYPEVFRTKRAEINQAIETLRRIYRQNFFPEMKTDYRARTNNLSHFVNDGCFRCHDGVKTTEDGKTLTRECTTCHLIVAQGPSERVEELESNIAGLEFQHPEDIDEAWREMLCTECHTPDQGY